MNTQRIGLTGTRRGIVGGFLLGWAVLATSASAAVVLSNITETSDSTGTITSSTLGAWSFTTGGSAMSIDTVSVLMGPAGNTGSEFVLRIRADNAGLPGTTTILGLDGDTQPNGAVGGSVFVFTPHTTGITLAANTTFWLAVGAKPGTGSYSVLTTESDTFTTSAGWTPSTTTWLSFNSGTTWSLNTTGIPMVSIAATAVPEPATYASGAALFLVGSVLARRRNRP